MILSNDEKKYRRNVSRSIYAKNEIKRIEKLDYMILK